MMRVALLLGITVYLVSLNAGAAKIECETRKPGPACDRPLPSHIAEMVDRHELWLSDRSKGRKADFRGEDLSRMNLDGADLRYAEMAGASLAGACLRRANLSHSSLNGANLEYAKLQSAVLSGALLNDVVATGVDMLGVEAEGMDARSANFSMSTLGGSNFGSARLSFAKLNNASVYDAIFERGKLEGADMTCVDARKASLRWADLKGVKLEKTELQETRLNGSQFSPSVFPAARSMALAEGLGELLAEDDWAGLTEIASKLDDAGFRMQARMVRASATHSSLIARLPGQRLSTECFSEKYAASCLYFGAASLAVGFTSNYRSDATLVLKCMFLVFSAFFVFYFVAAIWLPTTSAVLLSRSDTPQVAGSAPVQPEVYRRAIGQRPLRAILADFHVAFLVAGFLQLRFISLGSISAPSIFLGLTSDYSDVQLAPGFRRIGLVHSLLSLYLITLLLMTIVPLPFLTGG